MHYYPKQSPCLPHTTTITIIVITMSQTPLMVTEIVLHCDVENNICFVVLDSLCVTVLVVNTANLKERMVYEYMCGCLCVCVDHKELV